MQRFASYRAQEHSATQRILSGTSLALVLAITFAWCAPLHADEPSDTTAKPVDTTGDALDQALQAAPEVEAEGDAEPQQQPRPYMDPPVGAKALSEEGRAWIDREKNVVFVDGRIALRNGLLEMFACTPRTKEHESIVVVDSKAFVIHAGLLAVGAESGKPVQFVPEYKPPTGTQIDVFVEWEDEQGRKQRVKAQQWVRDARTKKPMKLPWVFAGSGFVHNEATGTSRYLAEDGDLVCVANFSSAMLDVPAEVSNNNASLLFEADTERIPPLGWPVRLVFAPALKDEQTRPTTDKQSGPTPTKPAFESDAELGNPAKEP